MVRSLALLLTIFFVATLQAKPHPTTFSRYPNQVFVETGTQFGHSVRHALEHGFEQVYSIELSPALYKHCCRRFINNPRVSLLLGDSAEKLEEVISTIDVPITFWLDAHYSGAHTAKGKTFAPLLQELEQIKHHPIKTHTILIDNLRLLGTMDRDYVTLDEVKQKLLEINPRYEFVYEDGYVRKDILVAKPSQETLFDLE